MRAMADRILVDNISFDGRHGLLPAERDVGVRFRVDLELHADLNAACASDHLSDTVDYRHVADLALEVGTQRSFHLVERLAQEIATAILGRFEGVERVTVQVRKLMPVLAGHPESVGVRITRGR